MQPYSINASNRDTHVLSPVMALVLSHQALKRDSVGVFLVPFTSVHRKSQRS